MNTFSFTIYLLIFFPFSYSNANCYVCLGELKNDNVYFKINEEIPGKGNLLLILQEVPAVGDYSPQYRTFQVENTNKMSVKQCWGI